MISETITKKASFLRKRLEESKILFVYRYLSLFITSTFYFLNYPEHAILKKIFIMGCVTIAAILLSYLYLIYETSTKNIKMLLCIETLGNSILLIPSGGINSPFIWYTLNTILISSVFLKSRYSWINFVAYLLTSSIIICYRSGSNLDILNIAKEESNRILSFIMFIAAVQAWSVFVRKTQDKSKRLEEVNIQLESANDVILESIDHIKALYQSVNILTNQGNKEGLINLLFEYIKKITRASTVFYYDISANSNKMSSDGNNKSLKFLEENIAKNLKNILEHKTPIEKSISNTRFIIVPVKSSYKEYGILGFEATDSKESIIYRNNIYQLQFLSELISVAFERFSLEEINERLLITEEQNRIANEIHDSVLQRLFSMSCGVFTLMKKLDQYTTEEIDKELNIVRKTTDHVMKELRAKIYGLSWKKSGSNSFAMDIKKYIDDIRQLNNVNIPFSVVGSDELLSCKQKKALYRMICEGIGNAVRHGKAKNIEVDLKINARNSILSITDDGRGFDLNMVTEDKTKGLGIQNLYQLTDSLEGELEIDSRLGNGTKIEMMIPNNVIMIKGEEATV